MISLIFQLIMSSKFVQMLSPVNVVNAPHGSRLVRAVLVLLRIRNHESPSSEFLLLKMQLGRVKECRVLVLGTAEVKGKA
jgi:hypothetical protein